MTEDFSTEAFFYLLDELDAERRATFAEHLARDPVARAAFKSCADALAQFACETAPAEALPPAGQRAGLAAVLAKVSPDAAERGARAQPARRWRHVWPLAAAVLLGLNLLQYLQSTRTEAEGKEEASSPAAFAEGGARPVGRSDRSSGPKAAAAAVKAPAEAVVANELRRLKDLRSDYARLQRSREALSAEYDRIIRQLAQRALVEQGVSRLAAMELVDSASYAKGERKGLINLARQFLTEPGIVAVEPVPQLAPSSPSVTPEISTSSNTASITGGAASAIALNGLPGVQGVMPAVPTPTPVQPVTAPSTPQAPATSGPPEAQSALPYAWSVFDETEHQGYLNLYNLPVVAADQSLQLWVKPADSAVYQRVGEVPAQFYGGSGSLYYKLPDSAATPAEILVTQEPRKAPVTKPTGPTVLRGP
jgi:hypothetical protein